MRHSEFEAWFRLLETPGVGRDTARRLLSGFGSPQAVLAASKASLQAWVGAALADALCHPSALLLERLQAACAWLDGGTGRHVLTLADTSYPTRLLHTADPPLLMYVQGDPALLGLPAVAVVGSRRPTVQGADNARAFAAALSQHGLVVVSGLALGIDAAAHEGALTGTTPTVAVVGTGLDRVYPARHRDLAHRIAQRGAVISEFAPGTPPLPENFPLRNRIIAGVSLGTLVVEAALQSGSLITARLALEAGREVFAVPGSIHSPQSKGCHQLLKQGAKLVESALDILEELQLAPPAQASLPLDDTATPADPLLDALGHDPVTLDALMARTGCPAAELNARLLELELDGQVSRLPGGMFHRRHAA